MQRIEAKITNFNQNIIEVTITNDTHTLAAPIVERLNKDSSCLYAAYKINHPNDNFVNLKIQGNENKKAKEILLDSIKSIIKDLDDINNQLKENN